MNRVARLDPEVVPVGIGIRRLDLLHASKQAPLGPAGPVFIGESDLPAFLDRVLLGNGGGPAGSVGGEQQGFARGRRSGIFAWNRNHRFDGAGFPGLHGTNGRGGPFDGTQDIADQNVLVMQGDSAGSDAEASALVDANQLFPAR